MFRSVGLACVTKEDLSGVPNRWLGAQLAVSV